MDSAEPFEAFVVRRHDGAVESGLETLTVADLPEGEVLVEVLWSTVNAKDAMVTVPGNRVARTSPLVPGVDLAGVVVESTEVSLPPGTEVIAHGHDIGVAHHGGFARYARLPASWVLPLPAGLTARQAMTVGTAGFTAALSVDELERRGLRPGDGPVLVTGATGGVGSFTVVLLAGRGYEVVASTGTGDAESWLRGLGATSVIGREALDEAPERVLGPERWAGAVDCVGGATLALVLRSLRYGAAVAASGLTAGPELRTTVYPFITRQVGLLGIDTVRTGRGRRIEVWDHLAGDLRGAFLDTLVDSEVPLADVASALARVGRGETRGRIVISVGASGASG
ncbi:MAG TPA: acryloyl-CoA reductase [Acidimicrobiales bacterium]|nr:acryloyl-CoA reductase [Acidimicrobiales bacterium]